MPKGGGRMPPPIGPIIGGKPLQMATTATAGKMLLGIGVVWEIFVECFTKTCLQVVTVICLTCFNLQGTLAA